ncbi:hypothetical protein COCON_G00220490 [Conger conger]|uniref:Uncharacterized protein n=1 Tax=Conger conger TaxID=82655 RepID=A0A9Q1HMW1_CONCO|nr:hypothetical protein COCON_G00220490 [Conger conger]
MQPPAPHPGKDSPGSPPNRQSSILTIPKQRSSSISLTNQLPRRAGAPATMSPLSTPNHSSPSEVAMAMFPDTADFLCKPSVDLHRPLGYTHSAPNFQPPLHNPSIPICSRERSDKKDSVPLHPILSLQGATAIWKCRECKNSKILRRLCFLESHTSVHDGTYSRK